VPYILSENTFHPDRFVLPEEIAYTERVVLPTPTVALILVNLCRKFCLSVELAII